MVRDELNQYRKGRIGKVQSGWIEALSIGVFNQAVIMNSKSGLWQC